MSYKNPKELLNAAAALPAAIEGRLPERAPEISKRLLEITERLPDLPDFPVELPDLPAVPEIPELPGAPSLGRRYVSAVEVKPAPATRPTPVGRYEATPVIGRGVLPEVVTRRGM